MRKALGYLLLIVITFLMQSSLYLILPSQWTTPALQIILICSVGLMRGQKAGMWTGLLSGLLYDLFFSSLFGFTAVCFLYIGYLSGALNNIFFDEDIRIPMAAVGIGTLAYRLICYLVEYVIHLRFFFRTYLTATVLPEVIASVLVTIPLYHVYRLIVRRISAAEREAEQSPWL